jgi:hypothetical protein
VRDGKSEPDSFERVAAKWRELHCEARKLQSISEIWHGAGPSRPKATANVGRKRRASRFGEDGWEDPPEYT